MLTENAPAKINFTLHISGQRHDGYHLLESLVAFTEFGDQISGYLTDDNKLTIKGRFGLQLAQKHISENLIIRARDALAQYAYQKGINVQPVHIICEKNLPIAAGLGGGSADAAATLRLLVKLWTLKISPADMVFLAGNLGADVPMCLTSKPLIAWGIGENIKLLRKFPVCHMVLVNPMIEMSTPDVFNMLHKKNNPSVFCPLEIPTMKQLIDIMNRSRNDLEAPATMISEKIISCLKLLKTTNPIIARMSGSGASCFALYDDPETARRTVMKIKSQEPNWFAVSTFTRGLDEGT